MVASDAEELDDVDRADKVARYRLPGAIGLNNLSNTCYINAGLQVDGHARRLVLLTVHGFCKPG